MRQHLPSQGPLLPTATSGVAGLAEDDGEAGTFITVKERICLF